MGEKQTLMRSMDSSDGTWNAANAARTIESMPPEKSIATRELRREEDGELVNDVGDVDDADEAKDGGSDATASACEGGKSCKDFRTPLLFKACKVFETEGSSATPPANLSSVKST